MNQNQSTNIVKLICLLSLIVNGVVFAEEAAQPKWFEVELIVFKTTNKQALLLESWDADTVIKTPQDNLIDFSQPAIKTSKGYKSDQYYKSLSGIQKLGEAFTPLDPSFLQLNAEADNLKHNPDYEVLSHVAWRQPVLNSKNAIPVRITGGMDFSEIFDYNGNKVSDYDNLQIQASLSGNKPKQNNKQTSAKPWVPELDGNIMVYLNRYLHIRTNLYLRRADKEKVNFINLEQYTPDKLSNIFIINDSNFDQTNNNNTLFGDPKKQSIQEKTDSEQQFSWQIEDDFLDSESAMYIDRLFNHSLKQSRKIRSKELHFFDHPLFGVLIILTPLEIQTESATTEN